MYFSSNEGNVTIWSTESRTLTHGQLLGIVLMNNIFSQCLQREWECKGAQNMELTAVINPS